MNVTPEINDSDSVTINVRPTITRIIGYMNDPNPSLGLQVVPTTFRNCERAKWNQSFA